MDHFHGPWHVRIGKLMLRFLLTSPGATFCCLLCLCFCFQLVCVVVVISVIFRRGELIGRLGLRFYGIQLMRQTNERKSGLFRSIKAPTGHLLPDNVFHRRCILIQSDYVGYCWTNVFVVVWAFLISMFISLPKGFGRLVSFVFCIIMQDQWWSEAHLLLQHSLFVNKKRTL